MQRQGFTLIQLLIVVAVVGILVSVYLNNTNAQNRDVRRAAELSQITQIIRIVKSDLPVALEGCTGAHDDVARCTGNVEALATFEDSEGAIAPCVGTAESAPSTGACQYSVSRADGSEGATTKDWQICTWLEVGVGSVPSGLSSVSSVQPELHGGCR